ncbi:hypothetical protein OROMI_006377 [Orobanche minor]
MMRTDEWIPREGVGFLFLSTSCGCQVIFLDELLPEQHDDYHMMLSTNTESGNNAYIISHSGIRMSKTLLATNNFEVIMEIPQNIAPKHNISLIVIGLKKNARKRTAYALMDVQKETSLVDSRRFRYNKQVTIASEALASIGTETTASRTG